MASNLIAWLLYAVPLLFFIFCPTIQFPWNPLVPFLVFRFQKTYPEGHTMTPFMLGIVYDCLLPSPRFGFYAFAFTLASLGTSRILRMIALQQMPLLISVMAFFFTMLVNMVAILLSIILKIPSKDELTSVTLLVIQPLLTGIVSFVLHLIVSLFSRRRIDLA